MSGTETAAADITADVIDTDYETDYEAGQDNVNPFGLEMHNPVFFISAALTIAFVLLTLIFPEKANTGLEATKAWTLEHFDWFFVIASNFVLLFCVAVAISPLGKIRLGGPDAKAEFGTASWIAMLFSAGIGIGMVFYGSAEPVAYYTDWGGTPLNVESRTPEAMRLALGATVFHWGLTPWAIYAVIGLALAFFAFNKGLPLTIRSAFYPLLGERIWGWPGHLIDILAVIATLFGLATSLGLGAQQAATGISFLFGIEASLTSQLLLIAVITILAIISVIRGMDGGIKLLSNINMVLAAALLAFVFTAGPTLKIFSGFGTAIASYAEYAIPLSDWTAREDKAWYHGWTIFYWAWWVSWSPFVGMFIARISRGRTIRQFLTIVLVVPVIVAIIWFTTFGVAAIEQIKNGIGQLPAGISEAPLVLFQMLENMPMPYIASSLAIILLIVFFVTSSDSGSLVIDAITAGGRTDAPVAQRIFWATLQGMVAAALLVGGGASALGAMQAGTIASGLPFTLVLLVCCYSLFKGLMSEHMLLKAERVAT
ncbi:BCCT family transporter [Parasphingorhabdus cellanae]|uniref:BCCT family transporter n=1 Tax=Parasphingorhabdus cellanae TaxID=2806553 RepID=A0ABX7T2G2_9SPHN|nr:BCCT family transporter [Parasphingorhabdus cellanae]QTD55746.1 BCCT family transporter [Parasphingorhabdus cellanae]